MTAAGRAPFAPPLYLVTDSTQCGARGVPETARAAVAGGVSAVQVRDPGAGGAWLYQQTRAVLDVVAVSGEGRVPVLVDDRLDVALAAGADGVHLGRSDLPVRRAREIAGPDFVLGWSVTGAADLAEVAALPEGTVDYLGLGPVFGTPTKPDAAEPLGLVGVRELAARAPVPALAIGGVTSDNAAEIAGTGVSGVCVVSEICAAADPCGAAERLLAAWDGAPRKETAQ